MNLDLDDPLGDLLSDGSNDSLFGFDTAISSAKKSSLPIKSEAKKDEKSSETKMEQLFGINDKKSEAIKPKTAELKLFSNELNSPVRTLPLRPATAAAAPENQKLYPLSSSMKSNDDFKHLEVKSNDSLSSDVGFDPKKSKRKMSILDELLGIGENSSLSTNKNQFHQSTAGAAKSVTRENVSQPSKATISRQTTSETVSDNVNSSEYLSNIAQSSSANNTTTAQKKTGRRQSAVAFSDPLGLFGSNEKEKEQIKKAQTKQSRKSIAGSEWLFNDPQMDVKPTVGKTKSSPAIHITPNSEDRGGGVDETIDPAIPSNVTSLESKNTITSSNVTLTRNTPHGVGVIESLVTQNVETQNTLNNLKQQEFQLMVATQMKTQENVLIEMRNKQQELLKQQESQFNELLRKQISRQSELEEIIKNQQERINSHIQALIASHAQAPLLDNLMINNNIMSSGGVGMSAKSLSDEHHQQQQSASMNVDESANVLEKVTLEADVKRLEMENLRLQDMLSNISDNHEKEVIMIEKSYKKRIEMCEENLTAMEKRYKDEIVAVETLYFDKIKSMCEERDSNLEALKLHYEEMVQNIRKSKLMEFAIREESSSYADVLKRASNHLQTASGDIQSLHELMQEKLINIERDKDILLTAREKRLEEQQKLLERTREMSEAEREKLLALVQSLELKLNSIEQVRVEKKSDEEQWSLRQKLTALEVEKKSFEKEKEFYRNQIASEQQKLHDLKEIQHNEHSKLLNELENERMKMQEQKAKMEIAKTLQSSTRPDSGISRAEIDAAVKYAEEAAKESQKQRERLIELQRLNDVKRHELMDQENSIRTREVEMENSIIKAKQREKIAESSVKQTKKTQLMLMAKYQSLQKYAMELSERETKIAKERLDVNQEKLNLQSQRKKLIESRCSLCKIGEKANELKGIIQKDPSMNEFDDINSANNEDLHGENFQNVAVASSISSSFGLLFNNQDVQFMPTTDLENVPILNDVNDDLLDPDLLALKFDILNSTNF